MLTNLQRINTGIVRLQEVPAMFFKNLEESEEFGGHLFPIWSHIVYRNTTLFDKFESVYNIYKAIGDDDSRAKIIAAFNNSNQVKSLCNCEDGIDVIELKDLDKSIQEELVDYPENIAIFVKCIHHPLLFSSTC